MKKRIMSFVLALLMVFSLFPASAFAEESVDVTITSEQTEAAAPANTAAVTAAEEPCKTCGKLGCISEHLNWCELCWMDDCGVDHTAVVEVLPCEKCGSSECGGVHENWCPDCLCDNCGVEHVFCEICQKNDCGQNHCLDCGAVDCTVEHTYCPDCGALDCTAEHSSPESSEEDIELAAENSSESAYNVNIGRKAAINPIYEGFLYICADPSLVNGWSSVQPVFDSLFTAELLLVIAAVYDNGSELWYKVQAAEGCTLPASLEASPWIFQNLIGDSPDYDSLILQEAEPVVNCPICGQPDCTVEHVQCGICGEYDCKLIHFWCDYCQCYDCGQPHLICPACGQVDCAETHTWCPYCGGYDCGIEHVDEYKPDTAPLIPENPTLTPGAEVSVVDEYGNAITALTLEEGRKTSLSAWPDGGADSYQWQVCYNNANMLWADIYGQTGKGILVSPAMFLSIIDYYGSTYIRCVASIGEESRTSAPIPVTVEEAVPVEQTAMFATAPRYAAANAAVAAEDGVNYSIIIEFKFPNGDTAAQAWTASLSAGADYVLDVECPAVVGYKPDRERITETITSISGNLTYTVTYQPDYVDYKVVHHQQNIGDNNYTAVKTETMTGLTGSPVGTGLEESYDGFYDLVYDSGITVAADGSTVINIYYDRYYYLVSLDMNGGFGVEPLYARYDTPINTAALAPQRTGYSFSGWDPVLPAAVPIGGSGHTAQWVNAEAFYTIAFWYENANDEEYTFVGSTRKSGTTGTTVSGTLQDYEAASFDGKDATNFKRLNADKTDKDVTIKADGTTVVNVYIYREAYKLTYYMWKCLHVHDSNCCNLYHTSHSDSCCSIPYHVNHTTGCVTNEIKKGTTYIPESDLNDAVPNRYNGVSIAYKYLGQTRYYVWFDGSWYRTADGNNGKDPLNWNCCRAGRGQYTHDHTSGCTCTKYHDHSSGCNTNGCTHTASWHCESDTTNQDHWTPVYSEYLKYEADTDQIHWNMLGMGDGVPGLSNGEYGLRWIPQKYGGFSHWNGDNAGNGTAVGAFTSMTSGDVNFYQGGNGSNQYEIQYWLEGADGGGSRAYTKDGDTRYFNAGTLFKNQMGNVAWVDEFQHGTPLGFEQFQATYGASQGEDTYVLAPNTHQSAYKYNNFYYIRKVFKLEYRNGDVSVTTRDMRYQQAMTAEYDLDGNSLGMKSPYGDGYIFGGWYMDPDGTIPAKFDGSTIMPNAGESGTIGLALYAKWIPVTHTVSIYQTKGGIKLGEYTVTHGNVIGNVPSDPVRDGYDFITWLYEEDGTVKAYNFSMPVYKDMALYAEWTSDSLASGTITYVDQATGKPIAEATPITGLVGASKTYSAKTGTELNSGYQTGYFPSVPSHNIEFSTSESQNNWIFYYTKMDDVAYTVRYVDKDTGAELMEATTGTSNAGKITVTHKSYSGYAADAYSKDLVLSSDPALNVVTFYYTKDDVHAPVQVEHYIQNTTGTGYTHYFTEQPYNGNIGEIQTAAPLALTGFSYNSGISTNTVELTASGLVLKLYYDRNTYSYSFRFVNYDTNTNLQAPVTGSALYGAQVSQVAPTIPGYDLTTSGSLTVTISDDESDNTRTFYYKEDSVTIKYQVGSVKGGTVSTESETVLAVTGTAAGSAATANTDYVFAGWYATYACTGSAISNDAHFVPSRNEAGAYEAKTYYAKFEELTVTVNYKIAGPDGSAQLSNYSEQVFMLSGKAEGSTVTPADKYEFAGWFDEEANKVGSSAKYVPTKSGDKWVDGTTYYAKLVEKKATINYAAVGNGTVSADSEQVNMVTGSAVGATATATENIARFVGWYDNEACTGDALSTNAVFIPAAPADGWAETQTYYAKFENIQYTISFDTNGGTPATIDPISYVYGDTLTLPTVENGNYIVTWTVKDSAGDWTTGSKVENGSIEHYGNVTLVANWTITAVWVDWDFNIITSNEEDILYTLSNVPYGTAPVYAGDLTINDLAARRNTAQYTYSFKEWVEEDLSKYAALPGEDIKGIIVYRASYENTVNKYTITWQDDAGNTIDTSEVEYGSIPSHADPTKEATAEFTYSFAGWTPELVAVTGDATYKATFTPDRRSYTITWLNDDDTLIDTTTVEYGTVPSHADPLKAATVEYTYTFAGWSPEVVAVTGEAIYKATYTAEKNKYTVTWLNEGGATLETDTGVEYGTMPEYNGAKPTKEATAEYSYIFAEWSPALEAVTGDVTYTATFAPHKNSYTITWVNHDGSVLEKDEEVEYGTMPSYDGATPTREADAQFSYSFSGWNPTVSEVTGEATYTAQFTQSINEYTVTWKNEDGTVLETDENVKYGTIPSYDGETPEKEATAQYSYTFDAWDKEVVAVTGDVTYTAKFSETVKKYTVTFVDEDGTTILLAAAEYEYGTAAENIVKPTDPTKESTVEFNYSFAGWSPAIAEVTEDAVYTATYSAAKNQYTLSVEWAIPGHGGSITPSDSVTKEYGEEAGITYRTKDGYKITHTIVNDETQNNGDIVMQETYTANPVYQNVHIIAHTAPIDFTITYELDGGTLPAGVTTSGQTYTIEDASALMQAPTKEGYKFTGWMMTEVLANYGNWEPGTFPAGQEFTGKYGWVTFTAQWERALVDLTITASTDDSEQSFIFTVSGNRSDGEAFSSIDVVLCSENNFTVTIKDMPVGEYTVSEKDGWSWRENSVADQTADLRTESQTVSFGFGVVDDLHWLSGYSYKRKRGGS